MRKFLTVLFLSIGLAMPLSGCNLFVGTTKILDLKLEYMIGADVALHHERVNSSETNVITFTFKVPGTYHIIVEPSGENADVTSKLDFDVTIHDVGKPFSIRPLKLTETFKITIEGNGMKETHEYAYRGF